MIFDIFVQNLNLIVVFMSALFFIYVIKFYIKVYHLPPGPFPLPLIGSVAVILLFGKNQIFGISKIAKAYGSKCTIWLGTKPIIFINNLDLAKNVFEKNHEIFGGRSGYAIKSIFLQNQGLDILFTDGHREWAELRKIGHKCIRKFVSSDSLPILISEIVENTMKSLFTEVEFGQIFNPDKYVQIIIMKIMASSILGRRYLDNESKFLQIRTYFKEFNISHNKILIMENLPIYSAFYFWDYFKCKKQFEEIMHIIKDSYEEHKVNNRNEKIKDICDHLIDEKNKLSERMDLCYFLNEKNMCLILFDLLLAGIETTKDTMNWVLLFLANFPSMQKRIRDEIHEMIGDHIPTQEDRNKCHFTQAFISEVLRFRNVLPFSVPHVTMRDSELENYKIPKETIVIATINNYMKDPETWENADLFDPDRFLIDGIYNSNIHSNFYPFGVGKRICLGEKLAQNNLFLMLAGILQKTKGMKFSLPDGPGSGDLEPDELAIFMVPKKFKIFLESD